MKALLGVLLLHSFHSLKLNDTANTVNQTLDGTYDQRVTELFEDSNFKTVENSTSVDSGIDSTVTISPPPPVIIFSDNVTTLTNVSSPTEDSQDTTTVWTTAPSDITTPTLSPPLLPAGSLLISAPDVSKLCPCDRLLSQCDVNCCCDPDCSAELPLFTHCLVHRVSGNSKLCSQEAAYYSIADGADGFAEVQTSIQQEVNSDLFCIHFNNNEPGLSHAIPEVPTPANFDGLFTQFTKFIFGSERQGATLDPILTQPGYQFRDVMRTLEKDGNGGFLRLPAPSVTAHCSDMNPAGFLRDQRSRCVRSLVLEKDCRTLAALNILTYTAIQPLAGKIEDAAIVAVEVASITYQSLEGTQTPVLLTDDLSLAPVLLATESESALCTNVVLQVGYVVTYSEDGEIVNMTVALTLGSVSGEMLPLEQEFHITFIQENAELSARYSGNPGYVVGLPLVAGSRTADGIVQSCDPRGALTLLYGTGVEDCLRGTHPRRAVLFGVDVVSGCTLRLQEAANCSQISELLMAELRGQAFPQYVASFGNSQPHNPMDWVPIKNNEMTMEPQSCSIPLSLHLTVEWTNYGSLVNPQAQIRSVKEVIRRNTSDLAWVSGGSGVISVSSSVTFVSVSAAALPGYRVPPTVEAKLPYGFFFPFV